MSDAGTATPTKAPRNVDYTLEIVDELPDRPFRTSPLEDSLEKIISIYNESPEKLKDKDGKDRWVVIGRYDNSTAAGAAANVLGQRHGKSVNVEGWEFTTRRIDEGDKTGLFVKYTPESVVPGAKEEWAEKEKARKAALVAKRNEKKAAEAGTGNGAVGAQGNASAPSAPTPSNTPPANQGAAQASAPTAPQGASANPSAPSSPAANPTTPAKAPNPSPAAAGK